MANSIYTIPILKTLLKEWIFSQLGFANLLRRCGKAGKVAEEAEQYDIPKMNLFGHAPEGGGGGEWGVTLTHMQKFKLNSWRGIIWAGFC